jgi:hypothetical protein
MGGIAGIIDQIRHMHGPEFDPFGPFLFQRLKHFAQISALLVFLLLSNEQITEADNGGHAISQRVHRQGGDVFSMLVGGMFHSRANEPPPFRKAGLWHDIRTRLDDRIAEQYCVERSEEPTTVG